jgi:hypothetical protein
MASDPCRLTRGYQGLSAAEHPERGKSGRGRTRTAGLTDVNPVNGDHVRNVISLEVELFNNWRLC